MLMCVIRMVVAASMLVASLELVSAQEMIPNPEFASWAKFRKGTSVTRKMTSGLNGITTETRMITTLLEVTETKVVVEISEVTHLNGMDIRTPPKKHEIPKTLPLTPGQKPHIPGSRPQGTVEEGTETMKIGGIDYKTRWYRTKATRSGSEVEGRFWFADEMPGIVVKIESTTKGQATTKTNVDVIEVRKP